MCSTRFPVMSLTKILETFIRSFPSSFNRKYVHTVACTVVFVGPAHLVFNGVAKTRVRVTPRVRVRVGVRVRVRVRMRVRVRVTVKKAYCH